MTSVNAATKPATKQNPIAAVNTPTKPAQIRLARRSPAYWRVTIDNPPINVMGPEMVQQFQEVIDALEADEHVRVVVFDSAVDDYFLNHSDFMAKLEDLTSMPSGPTRSVMGFTGEGWEDRRNRRPRRPRAPPPSRPGGPRRLMPQVLAWDRRTAPAFPSQLRP